MRCPLNAIGIYETFDLLLLFDIIIGPLEWVVIVPPVLYRFVRHPHRPKNILIKAVVPKQQPVHMLEEKARFRALDHPVVIS